MADEVSDVPVVLTPCSSCGRATRTTDSGACLECWEAKTSDGRAVIRSGPSRSEPLLGFSFDALDLLPAWVWWLVAGSVVVAIASVVRALMG